MIADGMTSFQSHDNKKAIRWIEIGVREEEGKRKVKGGRREVGREDMSEWGGGAMVRETYWSHARAAQNKSAMERWACGGRKVIIE